MHLIYFDESGNSGNNLNDPQQPVFVLGALIVPESAWQRLESDLEAELASHFPELASAGHEIHSGDLRAGRGCFSGVPVAKRVALRDAWLTTASRHDLKFVYRSILKSQYKKWLHETFGGAAVINPHVPAFALVSAVVNHHLAQLGERGIIISDENKEVMKDVEDVVRLFRIASGPLRLSQIIEKGFFIDSAKSRPLQLCDMCVLHARKKEEARAGFEGKPFDAEGIAKIEPLILRGDERFWDAIAWLKEQQMMAKKERPGG